MQPRVLLIDDDQLALKTYGGFFSAAGWECSTESDPQAGVETALRDRFDLVITDLVMPQMTGLEVLRLVREQKPQQSVIVLTGSSSVDDVLKALRGGAADVLLKPIDLPSLRSAVERVVSSPRTEEQEELSVYPFVKQELIEYAFTAAQAAGVSLHLGILDRLWKSQRIDKHLRLRLHLAIQEAFTNAIEHGCLELDSKWKEEFDHEGNDRFSREKKDRLADAHYGERGVSLSCAYNGHMLSVTIRDQGNGFPLSKYEGMSSPEKLLLSHGRGLAIICGTMDQVQFEDGGRAIVMCKFLD